MVTTLVPVRDKIALAIAVSLFLFVNRGFGLGRPPYVETTSRPGSFCIAQKGTTATLLVDSGDFPGVIRGAYDLPSEIGRVTGLKPKFASDETRPGGDVIIIGSLGRSRIIDGLVRAGKLDVASITNQWESFVIQVVPKPFRGVDRALVIAG